MGNVGKSFGVIENGGGGGGSVIQKTKAEFLALAAASGLEFPAVYGITDIFEGLYINTYSGSNFSHNAALFAYLPNYVEEDLYMGQYHAYLGAINDGEIYTWGEWNYKNESGGALTPDTPSANVFDSADRFTQLAKSDTNYYTLIPLNAIIDGDLNMTSIQNPRNLNEVPYYAISHFYSGIENPCLAQLNQRNGLGSDVGFNTGMAIYNNRVDESCQQGIYNNRGALTSVIKDSYIVGAGQISDNDFQADANVYGIVGNIRVRKNIFGGSGSTVNTITTADGFFIDILHNEFHDNNKLENISGTGENELYIWDNHFHEANEVSGWNIDNTFVKFANSHLNHNAKLIGFTYSGGGEYNVNVPFSQNITIENVENININAVSIEFAQNTLNSYDLSGFAVDIVSESIEAGSGMFSVTHDFDTSPLTSGSSVLYNLIPTGAKITSLSASGSLTGTDIEIGLEADDEDLISGAVASLPLEWNSSSAAATANRSLNIKAVDGNITGGILTVKVEFVV